MHTQAPELMNVWARGQLLPEWSPGYGKLIVTAEEVIWEQRWRRWHRAMTFWLGRWAPPVLRIPIAEIQSVEARRELGFESITIKSSGPTLMLRVWRIQKPWSNEASRQVVQLLQRLIDER